jgi:hypothetical protein
MSAACAFHARVIVGLGLLLFLIAGATPQLRADDGWKSIAPPTTADLEGICYGAGTFVTVGAAGTILTSSDGLSWTLANSGSVASLRGVCFGNAMFVAVGDHGTILTSSDGKSWTQRANVGERLRGVAYGAGIYVAVGDHGTVQSSADLLNWTTIKVPLSGWLRAVKYCGDNFVVSGEDGVIFSTEDGLTFRFLTVVDGAVEAVAYESGLVHVVGDKLVRISNDLVNWTNPDPFGAVSFDRYRDALQVGISLIAVAESGSIAGIRAPIFYPSTSAAVSSVALNSIASGSECFIAVGARGTIFRRVPELGPDPTFLTSADFGTKKVVVGASVRLSSRFGAPPPMTYQWTVNQTELSGANGPELLISDASFSDTGTYSVTATNQYGSYTGFFTLVVVNAPSEAVDHEFRGSAAGTVIPLRNGQYLTHAPRQISSPNLASHSIQRFNGDGSWDLNFSSSSSGDTITPLRNGKMLLYSKPTSDSSGLLIRLNQDGSTDATFASPFQGIGLILLPDDKFIGVTGAPGLIELNRYLANGSPDVTYPTTRFTVDPDSAFDSVIQSAGGSSQNLTAVVVSAMVDLRFDRESRPRNRSWIFRVRADGELDASLGVVPIQQAPTQFLHSGDRLYLKSYTDFPFGGHGSGGAHRLNVFDRLTMDGVTDNSYAQVTYASDFFTEYPDGHSALSSDGSLLVATNGGVIRYLSNGSIDRGFSVRLDHDVAQISSLADGGILVEGAFDALNGVQTFGMAKIAPVLNSFTTHLSNLSLRGYAGTGDRTLIAGFIVKGSIGMQSLLARAVGPGLVPLGISAAQAMADPQLTVYRNSSVLVRNDDWDVSVSTVANRVGAFQLTQGSKDAAATISLAAADHSVHVGPSMDSQPGIALVELYDANVEAHHSIDDARLANLSGRAYVGGGDTILIAGFVVSGKATKRLLIRAVGPALKAYGVPEALSDPQVTVYRNAVALASNDNWGPDQAEIFKAVGAFDLQPGSKDAAIIFDATPGVYSAVMSGSNGTTGIGLLEIYEVP